MVTKKRRRTAKARTAVERRVQVRLRQLREASGRTVDDVSEAAGLSWDALQNIEQGRRVPTLNSVVSLAEALGVSVSALLDEGVVEVAPEVRALARLLDDRDEHVRRSVVRLAQAFVDALDSNG